MQSLGVQKSDFVLDLFANFCNAQSPRFCTRKNSAFFYDWSLLSQNGTLWANPPFSQLDKVLGKILKEPCRIVLVTPNWKGSNRKRLLSKLSQAQFFVPANTPLYKGDWDGTPLPSPSWETVVSLLDTRVFNVGKEEIDPSVWKWLEKKCKGWDSKKLDKEILKYTPVGLSFEGSNEIQVSAKVSNERDHPEEIVSLEESPVKPTKLDFDIAWMQISTEMDELMAQLTSEVHLEFFEFKAEFGEGIQISPTLSKYCRPRCF